MSHDLHLDKIYRVFPNPTTDLKTQVETRLPVLCLQEYTHFHYYVIFWSRHHLKMRSREVNKSSILRRSDISSCVSPPSSAPSSPSSHSREAASNNVPLTALSLPWLLPVVCVYHGKYFYLVSFRFKLFSNVSGGWRTCGAQYFKWLYVEFQPYHLICF